MQPYSKEQGHALPPMIMQSSTRIHSIGPRFVKLGEPYVHLALPHRGHNQIAIDVVVARLEAMLQGGRSR